jgi:hypothetical protein
MWLPKTQGQPLLFSEETVQFSVDFVDHFAEVVFVVGEIVMISFNNQNFTQVI